MGLSRDQVAVEQGGMLLHPGVDTTAVVAEQEVVAQPQVTTFTRASAVNVETVDRSWLRFQNPDFRPPEVTDTGVERTSLALPTLVSPTATPDDGVLFEDPADATRKFFLTRYALAQTDTGAAPGRWVTFAPQGSGFLLTVHLADVTDASAVQGNGRLAPDTRYLISATLQGRIVTWDLTAAPAGADGSLVLTAPAADFAARDLLYAAMTDPAAGARLIVRRSLPLALPIDGTSRYSTASLAIDSDIAFTFNKDLDAAVFAGLGGAGAPLAPWKAVSVDWRGRRHTYFQSSSQADQVYFLPDAFKVGRQSASPHLPNLSVTTQGDSESAMVMTLSYFAAPEWDPARLADAGPKLQQILGLSAPPSLALFLASATALKLSLPSDDPTLGVTLTVQKNALIDLAAGVQGSITLGLAAFRQIYAALFDSRSTVLAGQVEVTVGAEITALPFIARMDDLAGDIFDTKVTIDSKANTMAVTLTNAIESVIRVASLGAVITRGTTQVPSDIKSMAPAAPVDLAPPVTGAVPAPGASVNLVLAPSPGKALLGALGGLLGGGSSSSSGDGSGGGLFSGLFGHGKSGGSNPLGQAASLILDSQCAPLFDFSHVTVMADPKATWRALMANGAPSPVSRVVSLKLLAASLAQPGGTAAPSADAVLAVQVVFQSGQTASFDASLKADAGGFLDRSITLTVPIEAFVLGDGPTDTYQYRLDTVTPTGVKKGDWITDNRDTIYLVPG